MGCDLLLLYYSLIKPLKGIYRKNIEDPLSQWDSLEADEFLFRYSPNGGIFTSLRQTYTFDKLGLYAKSINFPFTLFMKF
jgi:hypothetical protein